MRKITLILASALLGVTAVNAQESTPLVLSGSVDTYYKYDLSGQNNIGTSFNDEHNSIGLGMVNLIMSKEWKNVSFVGDLSFGPRGVQSIPGFDANNDTINDVNQFGIQNLYVSYAVNDVLSFDMGYMGTFIGYEVISPVDNFNYSTSYLFTNGPFQNAGLKANVAVSDKVDFMVGIFNDVNAYSNSDTSSFDLGAQVHVAPTEGLDVYVSYLTSENNFDQVDLTAGYQATDALYLGLNVAKQWANGDDNTFFDNDAGNGFFGAALYAQYAVSDAFAIGLRAEHFNESTDNTTTVLAPGSDDTSVNAFTLSGNYTVGGLTLIPEVRADFVSEDDVFKDSDGKTADQAIQVGLAAVYAF